MAVDIDGARCTLRAWKRCHGSHRAAARPRGFPLVPGPITSHLSRSTRLRRSAHRESVRRAAGRAGVALFQSLPGLGAIAASSCGEFGVGRSSLAQVLEGREAELPFLGHWLEESGHGGHQDAQSPQPVVYRVQAESAKHREDDGAADSQGRSGILECSMNKRAATITVQNCPDGPNKAHRMLDFFRRNWRTCPRMVLRSTPWHKVSASSSPRRSEIRGRAGRLGLQVEASVEFRV